MMLAAAIDDDWLEPAVPAAWRRWRCSGFSFPRTAATACLKWYSRLVWPARPGGAGPRRPGRVCRAASWKSSTSPAKSAARHDFDRYEETLAIYQRLGWYTFLCGYPSN